MALGVRTFVGWVAGVWRSARERIGLGRNPHLRDAPAADEVTDDLPSACLRGIRVPNDRLVIRNAEILDDIEIVIGPR